MSDAEDHQEAVDKPSPLQVIASVAAAAFGVQNSKNRKRDFAQNSMLPYIIGGIIFTILFVGGVYLVVSTVLSSSGAS